MKNTLKKLSNRAILCGGLFTLSAYADFGTGWSYQGELTKSGQLYSGTADLQFSLWTAETSGAQSGDTLTVTNLSVSSGRFAAQLDFGYDPFSAAQSLWLEIAVRTPSGTGSYSTLGNRQRITAAPYAIRTRGMFVTDTGNIGVGTATTPDFDLQVSRTRNQVFGPSSAAMGVRHDQVTGIIPNLIRQTNWLYLRAGLLGNDLVRNNGSDLHFMREATIEDADPLTQMTLTDTGKLLLGTETEQFGLTLQVGDHFGVSFNGRLGFDNANPQAKIHFSNSASTDCIRFPNGTVQNTAPFTDAHFLSGAGGMPPASTTGWVTTPSTVTVSHRSQRVFVLAHQEIRLFGNSKGLVLYVGYRPLTSTAAPTLVGSGMACSFYNQDVGPDFQTYWLIAPASVSAILQDLDPGVYQVGMAGQQNADPGSGYGAGRGYVTAFVF